MKRFSIVLFVLALIFIGCRTEPKIINVESVSLDETELSLVDGDIKTLTATIEPENADNKNVVWSSSNEAVAKVENGKITAISEGEAVITVTTDDGGKTAFCTVTVVESDSDVPQLPSDEPEPVPVVVSDAFFWGEWTRMDNGKSFIVKEDKVTYDGTDYNITSSTSTLLAVTDIGSFIKESDSVMICENIPYFRNGGTNLEYKLKIVGFSNGRAAETTGLSGIKGKGKSKTYKSFESEAESDANGEIAFKAPTINDIQTVTIDNNGNDVVISNLRIQNSGDFMGTVAIVDSDQYNLKITGVIAESEKQNGYLYGNNMKEYPMTITITNISDVKCKTSVCKIEPDDPNLVLSSSTNLEGLVISTLPEGGTKEISLTAKYGELEESFVDTGIKITILNPTTQQEWTDYIPLRFYRGTIPIAISAKSPERNANAALNGFIIYPDGNNQFFTINENSSKVIYVPTFGADKKYKMIFSGATVTSELSASTEMFYTVSAGSKIPVIPVTEASAEVLAGYIGFGGNNNTEDTAYNVDEDFEAYLSEGEIDYYTITAESDEYYPPTGKNYSIVNYESEYAVDNVPASFVILNGTALTAENLPELSDGTMNFDGWYAGDTKITSGTYTVTDSVTLIAHWSYKRYTITYNLGGGTNAASNVSTYTVNDELFFAAPSKDYYTFEGWYGNADFTGTVITGFAAGTSGVKTLYAKWLPVTYTITYILDDKGTNAATNPTTYTVESDEITFVPATSESWGFGGWYTDSECTGAQTVSISAGSHDNVTLYARWAEKRTVTYVSEHGTQPESIVVAEGTVLSSSQLAALTDDAYVFAGWYTDNTYTTQAEADTYTVAGGNISLYAKWLKICSISYVSEYGSAEPITIVEGTGLAAEHFPTLEGELSLFQGWYSDAEFENSVSIGYTVLDDLVLYASWGDLETYWSWSYPTSAPTLTWAGRGTEDDPYIIKNSQELADLAFMVNNYTSYSGTYFELAADIELNYGKTVNAEDETLNNWIPIGNETYSFDGIFEGSGKKINGLYINNDTLTYVGLFGKGKGPKNLTIESGYVVANATYAGGVIGYSTTALENCTNKSDLTNSKWESYLGGITGYGSSFTNCVNTGILSGSRVGGICARGTSFEDCSNSGEITAAGTCGGISGIGNSYTNCSNSGEITASGTYTGGIGAYTDSWTLNIENCTNTADITTQGSYLGGIFGYISKSAYSDSYNYKLTGTTAITIKDSNSSGKLVGSYYVGGIISYISSILTPYGSYYSDDRYNTSNCDVTILNCKSTGDIEFQNGIYIGGICGYICLKGHRTSSNIIKNCLFDAELNNTSLYSSYIGGICGYVVGFSSLSRYEYCDEDIFIINSKVSGVIEDSSASGKIGGIAGYLDSSTINNCFANILITSAETSNVIGGIVGGFTNYAYLNNCFYVAGKGANYAAGSGRSTDYETNVGAAVSPSGAVFPSDGTTLQYSGNAYEVLNAYISDNDTDNSYKTWIAGDDGWPTLSE